MGRLIGMRDRNGAQIDLARLPDDVARLIADLAPGGKLVITRGGEQVATIVAAGSAPLEGMVIPARSAGDDNFNSTDSTDSTDRTGRTGSTGDDPADDGVMVVATTMKLSDSARTKLSNELGADYIVLDMHSAPSTADVLLVPPISPQLLTNLREMFPVARVVVAELEDPELGINYRGPVRRLIDSGAELYLASTNVPHLARQLGEAVAAGGALGAGRHLRLELE
ncbi:hypothetical protein Caci_3303 [Catenulispora acidiphila DSM 44928]|uniref:Uncharacterized protein n=2 Tax=Catenulispora TaxID=414878 RepID=C7Q7L7_CATAD|nr:hypothetical protein Caci_3303 [Catenulispora acidiphila DSM 44928]